MVLIQRLVIAAAIIFSGTPSATALSMQECRAQYRADFAARDVRMAWVDYQVKRCGIDPKATPPTQKPTGSKKH